MFISQFAATTCAGVNTTVINCSSNGGIIYSLLTVIVNFMALLVGIAVLAGIIYGAILYASSGATPDQAKKGIGYIRNALLALLLFVFMYAIIQFIIPGGVL